MVISFLAINIKTKKGEAFDTPQELATFLWSKDVRGYTVAICLEDCNPEINVLQQQLVHCEEVLKR